MARLIAPIRPEPSLPEPPPRRRFPLSSWIATALLAAIVAGAVAAAVSAALFRFESRTNPQRLDLGSRVTINEDTATVNVIQKALPAVVSIVTRDPAPAQGSGFLVTSDGFVVTNVAVVANASTLAVLLATDSRRHDARVVDYDCQTGLALLKVDQVSNLPTLAFTDSSGLKVGQSVVALGGGLGDRRAASRGIVSGLHRNVTVRDSVGGGGEMHLSDVIATDSALDSSLSGGPMLNVGGQVVGVTMTGLKQAPPFAFALAANSVQPEVEQIIQSGRLLVASLGAQTVQLSAEDAALKGTTVGAEVLSLSPGGPGERAGLRAGDVITQLDDQRVDASHPLAQLLRTRFKPGQRVTVSYNRGSASSQLQLGLLGERPPCL